MSRPSKKTEYLILGLLSVFLVAFTAYNFGFEIYTHVWHLKNPEPLVINNLKITIPPGLVGRITETGEIEASYLRDPLETTIYVRQVEYHTDSRVCDLSVGRVAKNLCKISGKECVKIRFNRDESGSGYIEDLYLPDEKAYISFQGKRTNRHYLIEMIQQINTI